MLEIVLLVPWIVFVVGVPLALKRRPRLADYPAPDRESAPLVSIIVPARNEARNIGACVSRLLGSAYPRREVIIVDDRSDDATRELACALAERSAGAVRVVTGERLPEGWFGKPWACWQGYKVARGDLLLFTDADTRHQPETLSRAVAALEAEGADLVSLLPHLLLGSFWEYLVMPQVSLLLSLRYRDLERMNRATNPRDVLANGQFILVRREAYEAVGGHEAVRGDVAEDIGLAQRFVAAGRRILLVYAPEFLETRMYRSLSEIVEGWSKNLALGSRLVFPSTVGRLIPWLAVLFLLGVWVLPPLTLAATLVAGAGPLVWSASATGLSLLFWALEHVRLRIPVTHALLYPLGAAVTAWIFARSAIRGERLVVWKGRVYLSPRTRPGSSAG